MAKQLFLNTETNAIELHTARGQVFTQDDSLGYFFMLEHKFLGAIARGEIDLKDLAQFVLDDRGYDGDGNWVGLKRSTPLPRLPAQRPSPTPATIPTN